MIHVERFQVDEQRRPIRPDERWFKWAQRATERALEEGAGHHVMKKVYADDRVRIALARIFSDKCAYCESKMASSSDWNVEHFRPSKRVEERPSHPGYYWLTYDWTNLYMSCQHCNQRRRIRADWSQRSPETTGGKMCQFPLIEEHARAMNPSCPIEVEQPLLIDPCQDLPEKFLSYGVMGEIFPKNGNSRARETIRILHLSRRQLKNARAERATAFAVALKLLCRLIHQEEDALVIERFKHDLCTVYLKDSAPYAAVSRTMIRNPEAFGIDGILERLFRCE